MQLGRCNLCEAVRITKEGYIKDFVLTASCVEDVMQSAESMVKTGCGIALLTW